MPIVKRRAKYWIFGLFGVYVCLGMAREAYRFLDERAVRREAEQWRSLAAAATTPAFDYADARQWLEDNGFRVVIWNPHVPDGYVGREETSAGPKHWIVLGQRNARRGNWLVRSSWLDARFRFTESGHFQEIVVEPSPLQTPATLPAPAAEPA